MKPDVRRMENGKWKDSDDRGREQEVFLYRFPPF
jgi:hypothetical protein